MEKWHKNCCMCVAGKQQQWHTSRSHRLDYFFQPPSLHPHQRIIQFMLSTSQFTHAKGCLPFWNWSWLLLRVMWGRECTGVISPVQRLISSFSISSFPFGKIIIRVLLVILHRYETIHYETKTAFSFHHASSRIHTANTLLLDISKTVSPSSILEDKRLCLFTRRQNPTQSAYIRSSSSGNRSQDQQEHMEMGWNFI